MSREAEVTVLGAIEAAYEQWRRSVTSSISRYS
jgi:hypothetical protein